jgi:hypothetical protein
MPKKGAKNPKPEPGTPQSPPPTGCEVGGRTVEGRTCTRPGATAASTGDQT